MLNKDVTRGFTCNSSMKLVPSGIETTKVASAPSQSPSWAKCAKSRYTNPNNPKTQKDSNTYYNSFIPSKNTNYPTNQKPFKNRQLLTFGSVITLNMWDEGLHILRRLDLV